MRRGLDTVLHCDVGRGMLIDGHDMIALFRVDFDPAE
jgi:hypothetical protein